MGEFDHIPTWYKVFVWPIIIIGGAAAIAALVYFFGHIWLSIKVLLELCWWAFGLVFILLIIGAAIWVNTSSTFDQFKEK